MQLTITRWRVLAVLLFPVALWLALSAVAAGPGRSWPGAAWFRAANQAAGEFLLARGIFAEDPAGAGEAVVFAWTDGQGAAHFAPDAAQVPAAHRAKARRIALPGLGSFQGRYARVAGIEDVIPAGAIDVPNRAPGEVVAVVYGAEWCTACHQAEKHLRDLGAKVEIRDVEKDFRARAELARLVPGGAAIPVILFGETVVRGFDPDALTREVNLARSGGAVATP